MRDRFTLARYMLAAFFLTVVFAWAGTTNFDTIQLDPTSADTNSLLINDTAGTAQVTVTAAGAVTFAGAVTMSSTLAPGGNITLENSEVIQNDTDDIVELQGGSGTDDTDIQFDLDGTHPVISSGTDSVVEVREDVTIVNPASGNVVLDMRDYSDTTDDDQAHAQFVVNCTDPNSASEDCDLDIQLALAGAAPASYLLLDADGDAIATKTEWQIRLQNGAAPEATCVTGELFIDTDETDDTNCTTVADNSLCLCTATDTWTALENN